MRRPAPRGPARGVTPMDPESPRAQIERHRRGCFGCLFTSSLGCLAFLAGCTLAAFGFAPSMLGGPAARLLEGYLDDVLDGDVSIGELELAWNRVQAAKDVRLLDPDGRQVLALDLAFPSLLQLVDVEPLRWKLDVTVREADVVVDQDGSTNLERALALGGDLSSTRRGRVRVGAFDSERGLDQPFTIELRVRGYSIDLKRSADAEPFATIDDVDLRAARRSEGWAAMELDARVGASGASGHVRVSGERAPADPPGTPDAIRLNASWTDVPTVLVDELLGRGGITGDLLGSPVSGSFGVNGDVSVVALEAEVHGAGGERAELVGTLAGGILREGEDGLLAADLRVPAARFDELFAPLLPEGVRVARDDVETPWELRADGFSLPLEPKMPATFLGGVRGSYRLRPPGSFSLRSEAGELCSLSDVDVTLGCASGVAPELKVSARVGGGAGDGDSPADRLDVVVEGAEAADGLDRIASGEGRLRAELDATGVPTAVLDHLTGLDGLLSEALGEVVSLKLDTRELTLPLGPTTFELESRDRRASLAGVLDAEGAWSEGQERLEVDLPLTPRVSGTILHPVLPWIDFLPPDDGSGGARLVVEGYRLPFDRDPARVRAVLRLELGTVSYTLHPGFQRLFRRISPAGVVTESIPPVRMTVDRQIVRYDELALSFGLADEENDEYDFTGTLDLSTEQLSMQGDVSIAMVLRPGVDDGSGLLCTVNISGPWDRPMLSVDRRLLDAISDRLDQVIDVFTDDGR